MNANLAKRYSIIILLSVISNATAQQSLQTDMPLLLWDGPSNSVSALYMVDSIDHVTNYLFGTSHGFAFGSPVGLGGNLNAGVWAITGTQFKIDTNGFSGNGSGLKNISGSSVIEERHELILSNGINPDIVCGTNVFIEVIGPSGPFSIEGIAGGTDGKKVELLNLTGQNMTIAVEGGATGNDPLSANRIISMPGPDQTTLGNGFARLKYDSRINRWVLIDFNP